MISGTILPAISASNFVVVAIPRDKIANAILDGCLRLEPDVAHKIPYVYVGFHDVARLHRQHILDCLATQLLLQQTHHVQELFRPLVTDIVDPRRRRPRASAAFGDTVHEAHYDTGDVVDMGEVAAHVAMVKEPDRGPLHDRIGEQEDRHIRPPPWPIDSKE